MRGMRCAAWFISLCCLLPVTGCWDAKDVDNRMLVGVMGIEQNHEQNNEIRVWLRFPTPTTPGVSEDGKDFFTTSQIGHTVVDATNRLRLRLPKALDLSSTRTLLIDQDMAKSGLKSYLDFAIRERSVPLDTVFALVSGDMKSIFNSANPTGELSGVYSKLFFEPYAGGIPRKNRVVLWQIYSKLYNPLQSNLIPVLKTEQNMFSLEGNAYFSGDQYKGMLTPDESLLYEIISERIGESELELTHAADVNILTNHTRVKAELSPAGQPKIRIHSSITVTLIDSSEKEHLNTAEIEEYLEKRLCSQAKTLFEKTQQGHSDIFGFGNYYRAQMKPADYQQWPDMFSRADIEFELKVRLRNTGLEFVD